MVKEIGSTAIQIKRTSDGNLQAVKGQVSLSIKRKEIAIIQGTPSITATGYDRLNQVAGLSLILPKKIEVPMQGLQPNPFFILDQGTGSAKFIIAKMSAVGYSPVGSMCVSEQTLMFDLGAYLKIDAMSKIKSNRSLGKTVNKSALSEEETRSGLFLPILDENFGVWLDGGHEDFSSLMREHMNRVKFAERIAMGILRRNCLRHHPSIATSTVEVVGGESIVTVMGYRHNLDESSLRSIVNNKSDESVERISETINTEDMHRADVRESSEEMVGASVVNEPQEDLSQREKYMIRVSEIRGIMGLEKYHVFYRKTVLSERPVSEFSDEEIKIYVAKLEKEIV